MTTFIRRRIRRWHVYINADGQLPAGYAWVYDADGKPVYDAEGRRLAAPIEGS